MSVTIPRVLHRILIGDPDSNIPFLDRRFVRRFEHDNPDLPVTVSRDPDIARRLESYPVYRHTYDAYQRRIQQADFARYLLLYEEGGVYADFDIDAGAEHYSITELLVPIEERARGEELCVLIEEKTTSEAQGQSMASDPIRIAHLPPEDRPEHPLRVASYFLASTPKHPFIKGLLNLCVDRSAVDARTSDYAVLFSTDGDVVTTHFHKTRQVFGSSVVLVPKSVADRHLYHVIQGHWKRGTVRQRTWQFLDLVRFKLGLGDGE